MEVALLIRILVGVMLATLAGFATPAFAVGSTYGPCAAKWYVGFTYVRCEERFLYYGRSGSYRNEYGQEVEAANDLQFVYRVASGTVYNAAGNALTSNIVDQLIGIATFASVQNWPDQSRLPASIVWTRRFAEGTIYPRDPPPVRAEIAEKAVGAAIQLVDGTKDMILAWVRNGGDKLAFLAELGERVTTGLGGSVSQIGGLVIAFQQGLLDPEVWQGVRVFADALRDPDPNTRGLGMSPVRRRALQQAMDSIEQQRGQIVQPKAIDGGRNSFDVPVKQGPPLTLDPPLATGFAYDAPAGGPLFASFALPLLVPNQGSYVVEVYEGSRWRKLVDARPLAEYRFPRPVLRFRVRGVPPAAKVQQIDTDHRWLTMVTFNRKGRFRGSIRSLAAAGPGVP